MDGVAGGRQPPARILQQARRPGVGAGKAMFGQAAVGDAVAVHIADGGQPSRARHMTILAGAHNAISFSARELRCIDALRGGVIAVEPLVKGAFNGKEIAVGEGGRSQILGIWFVTRRCRVPTERRVVEVVTRTADARLDDGVAALP